MIEHSLVWCRGEIQEGSVVTFSGLGVVIAALIFHLLNVGPYVNAIVLPVGLVGLFCLGTGFYLIITNRRRRIMFQNQYTAHPDEFVRKERLRVQRFIAWYPITRRIAGSLLIIGILTLIFVERPLIYGYAVGLILFAIVLLAIDYFSEKRAHVYQKHLAAYQSE